MIPITMHDLPSDLSGSYEQVQVQTHTLNTPGVYVAITHGHVIGQLFVPDRAKKSQQRGSTIKKKLWTLACHVHILARRVQALGRNTTRILKIAP